MVNYNFPNSGWIELDDWPLSPIREGHYKHNCHRINSTKMNSTWAFMGNSKFKVFLATGTTEQPQLQKTYIPVGHVTTLVVLETAVLQTNQ